MDPCLPTPWGRPIANSYSPNGGWYIMVIPEAYQMAVAHGTTHFTPYSYDRHVPLGFYGAPFAPGTYDNLVQPVDLAATFAALLRIGQPSASVGHILTEALRPSADIVYPKPPPPPRVHHTVTRHAPEAQPKLRRRNPRLPRSGPASMKPDMRVQFAGIELANPVIAASGTFGYGVEFEEIISLLRIGGFVTKGISLEPMPGNQAPRIVETAAGMLNAIGLQNVGVEQFISRSCRRCGTIPHCGSS